MIKYFASSNRGDTTCVSQRISILGFSTRLDTRRHTYDLKFREGKICCLGCKYKGSVTLCGTPAELLCPNTVCIICVSLIQGMLFHPIKTNHVSGLSEHVGRNLFAQQA